METMSTCFTILKVPDGAVVITERSAKYDLDLYDAAVVCRGDDFVEGPQGMTAYEALKMAAGIIYAVWCSYPDMANHLVESMTGDCIPDHWNHLQSESKS
jgi:hypothetical protein